MQKLLLLHGALGSKNQFAQLQKRLKNDFEIHTINFSGHGGEIIPEQPFSINLFAKDVLTYLNKVKIDKINIFGYSMGGYAGLYLAKKYPDRINNIFTIAAKFKWNEEIAAKEIKMLNPLKIKEKIPAFAEELKERHSPQNWETILVKTAEMMINLGKHNELMEEGITSIEQNVCIGVGDCDKMVSIEETVEVYRMLKNGQMW
jgi:esterase/lipase